MAAIWSYLLATIGVTGLYIAAKNPKLGWRINIGAQVLWLVYAVVTQQWGFIVSALAYGFVYIRLLRRSNYDNSARADP